MHLDLRFERVGRGRCELSGRFESVVRDVDGFEIFTGSGTYEARPISVSGVRKRGGDDRDDDD